MVSYLFLLVLLPWTCLTCTPNNKPVIGIMTQSLDESEYPSSTYYIGSSYVKFVEMFGGRVVPILPNQPKEYYQNLRKKLNGVVFPGGDVSLYNGFYALQASNFYRHSIYIFDQTKEVFPILGICLGFEQLATLAANKSDVMSDTDSNDLMSPIEFTQYGLNDSKVFKNAPLWLLTALSTQSLAPNFHHSSLLTQTYESNSDIQDVFEVVANAYDRNGLKYVAVMEGKRYPFLATQYHPEKNLFEWEPSYNLAHNFTGAAASQYIGDYFLQMTRKSCQKFDSEEELDPYLIYHYNQTYTQHMFSDKHFTQMYLFNY